jgi:prepilin-type N-terminal cleavage/methylation domain-containing protein
MDSHVSDAVRLDRGFSLGETTIVVAIVGVMTALAVPMISQLTADSSTSKNCRIASEIASMAASAVAAGDTTIPEAADAEAAVRILIGGVTITEGIEGMHFRMRGLSESEIGHVVGFLRMENGLLVFRDPADAERP